MTAAAALVGAWLKSRTDRRQELRRERREVYERFHHAGVRMWETLGRIRRTVDGPDEPAEADLRAANDALVEFGKVYGELSMVASDDVWIAARPMFDEMRSAVAERRLPSGPADDNHDEELRRLIRRDLRR